MERKLCLFIIAVLLLVPAAAAAQAPPNLKPPLAREKEMRDPDACVEATATVGKGGGLELKKPEDRTLSGRVRSRKESSARHPVSIRRWQACAGRRRHAGDPATGLARRQPLRSAEVSVCQ